MIGKTSCNVIGVRKKRISVFADNQALVLQHIEVFARGHVGHIEYVRKFGDFDAFLCGKNF